MLIGIDGNEANISARVGVNVYAFELLCSIYKLQDIWKDKHQFIIYLKNAPQSDLPQETESWQYKVLPGKGLWIITRLMPHLFLTKKRPSVFFTPSHYTPPFAPMPRVVSIMDLGYLKFSGQFRRYDFWQLKLWTAWSIKFTRRVIAISQSTKDDIVRHYPSSSRKISVTHLAYDKEKFNTKIGSDDISRIKHKFFLKNYILFLSTLKPSKNIEGLLRGWAQIVSKYPDFSLVVAGKKGWLYERIFALVKELKLTKQVVFTDFISEEDKPALIAGARVFVLPSFWEGFGLDVLNAMAVGTPTIAAQRGSLPEVVGKAGILIDPEDSNSIAQAIDKVLSMKKTEYNKLIAKGLAHVEKFSWEKTARETLKILEGVK